MKTVWYLRLPGASLALDFRFEKPVDGAEARKAMAAHLGKRTLPKKAEVW